MTKHHATPSQILPATTTTDDNTVHAPVAVLPIGAFEQHGPYLPLVTDTLIATAIADAIGQHHNIFQLAAVTYGCSHEHASFPGTISIQPSTLIAIIRDIAASLELQGINALMVVNGHGGNYALANIVQQLNADGAMQVGLFPTRDDWTEARGAAGMSSSSHDDMHAGELETSILLAAQPAYLRDGWHTADHVAADRRHLTTLGMPAYTTSGVIGYPSKATADKGRAVLDHLGQAAGVLMGLLNRQKK